MRVNNHPKKGDRVKVDPVRNLKDIQSISKLTASNPRDHLLWTMGINNGLRTCDLLKLKVKDVRKMKAGDTLTIKESKTGKDNVLMINKTVYKALKSYLDRIEPDDSEYLFRSRKGNAALGSQAVSQLVKKWAGAINLNGNYGAHTLRKTFGYVQRKMYGVGFEIICKRYNHSSPAVTMRYLGIEDREVNSILMNDIG